MVLDRFVSRVEFDSYEDFRQNFRILVPPSFNFAYDVVDEIAERTPDKLAMVWCDDKGAAARFTFAQMRKASDRTAQLFRAQGIRKGDPVMLILKRRYEFWFSILALHKLGAIAIPATHLLTTKDLVYRNNAADIKMIVAVADSQVLERIDASQAKSPSLCKKVVVGGSRPGWIDFDTEYAGLRRRRVRPPDGRRGGRQRGHLPPLLHLGHDRLPEDGPPRLHLPARPHPHRALLAGRRGRRPAPHGLGYRLGEVRLGQDLRAVDRRLRR